LLLYIFEAYNINIMAKSYKVIEIESNSWNHNKNRKFKHNTKQKNYIIKKPSKNKFWNLNKKHIYNFKNNIKNFKNNKWQKNKVLKIKTKKFVRNKNLQNSESESDDNIINNYFQDLNIINVNKKYSGIKIDEITRSKALCNLYKTNKKVIIEIDKKKSFKKTYFKIRQYLKFYNYKFQYIKKTFTNSQNLIQLYLNTKSKYRRYKALLFLKKAFKKRNFWTLTKYFKLHPLSPSRKLYERLMPLKLYKFNKRIK
jgi:hypothetical protein